MALRLKHLLPRSLMGRALLIILVPLVVVQLVAFQVFYGSHLNIISRRLSSAVVGEIATTIELLRRMPDPADQAWALQNAWEQFELAMHLLADAPLPEERPPLLLLSARAGLAAALEDKLHLPFTTDWRSNPQSVMVSIQMPDSVLQVEVPRKRLTAVAFYVFVLWLVGASLLLFGNRCLVHAQPGAGDPPAGQCRGGVRHGPRHRRDQARGCHRGAPGRGRVQPHAGADSPLPAATDRDAGGGFA